MEGLAPGASGTADSGLARPKTWITSPNFGTTALPWPRCLLTLLFDRDMKLTPISSEGMTANPFAWSDRFVHRHLGPRPEGIAAMLKSCGFPTLDQLIDTAVPQAIRMPKALNLPPSRSEHGLLAELRLVASQNLIFKS